MKTPIVVLIGSLLLALVQPATAARKSSKLSEFSGSYSGTIFLNAAGTPVSGTTTGVISASKKKEIGTVALTSVIDSGGTLANFNETYGLNNRSLKYTIFISPSTVGTGTGRANIKKTAILYSGTFETGGAIFNYTGTMRKSKNTLRITELITGPTTLSVTYTLRKRGKN